MNSEPLLLKSIGVARVLLWSLRISLAWDVISAFSSLIPLILPSASRSLAKLQFFLVVPSLCLLLVTIGLFLVWIYRLHQDLCQCYKNYPIDAGSSLSRLLLPVYNIWGFWNILITIARSFKAETGQLYRYGLSLSGLIPVFYGLVIALYLLQQWLYTSDAIGRVSLNSNIPVSILPIAIAGKRILGLGGTVVLLAIAQIIMNAIKLKARQINTNAETL